MATFQLSARGIYHVYERGNFDAFGRRRVSMPYTIFDSAQIGDKRPLFFDDQQTSGGGTDSVYSANDSTTVLSVSATTAGTRVRQTFQRFRYQPGKSHLILVTGVLGAGVAGITRRIGYFDANNGVFFEMSGTTIKTVVRKGGVDTAISKGSWKVDNSIDRMDGTGPSKIALDFSKTNIFLFDMEWLGVGTVRFGVVIDGVPYYVNEHHHANVNTATYMRTANLPVRFEISNDGNAPAATLSAICCSVISEGGQEETGITRYFSTAGTHIDANAANTIYAIIGIRLKAAYLDSIVKLVNLTVIGQTGADLEWILLLNPTVAGDFVYADQTNSSVQTVVGATANTVTGGTALAGGMIIANNQGAGEKSILNSLRYLGSSISGTPDTLVLCVRPLSANADIEAGITWTETA